MKEPFCQLFVQQLSNQYDSFVFSGISNQLQYVHQKKKKGKWQPPTLKIATALYTLTSKAVISKQDKLLLCSLNEQ